MDAPVIQFDPKASVDGGDPRVVAAAEALAGGKLVAIPTETVYGLAASAASARGFRRLRAAKDRPTNPFSVHIASPADAARYVLRIPLRARGLMAKAWPGPVTMLLTTGGRAGQDNPLEKTVYNRIVRNGVVGLRCPSTPATRAILAAIDAPVVASSANPAGNAPATDAASAVAALGDRIDLMVDAGPTPHQQPSTIVAFEGEEPRIVRAGVYSAADIRRMAAFSILFICTGNTCRSPMAEGLARRLLAERMDVKEKDLGRSGISVTSAGVFTFVTTPASDEAVSAVSELGGDIRRHRSRKLTNELINEADLIFCMARSHAADVTRRVSGTVGKTFLLDPDGDIADPIGGSREVYLSVARRIDQCLRQRMKENWL